jgi:hypothetical protein
LGSAGLTVDIILIFLPGTNTNSGKMRSKIEEVAFFNKMIKRFYLNIIILSIFMPYVISSGFHFTKNQENLLLNVTLEPNAKAAPPCFFKYALSVLHIP